MHCLSKRLLNNVPPVLILPLAAASMVLGTACLPNLANSQAAVPTAASSQALTLRIGKSVRGDLKGVMAFAADLKSAGTINVVPRVTARLNQFDVEIGTRVRTGDPLVELDRADLEAQVLEAQAAQAAAEAKLAQVKAGPKPEAVAAAQASVKAAQVRVDALSRAQARNDPATLQKRVDDAQAALDKLLAEQPDPRASTQAEAAVTAAQSRLNQILADGARANDKVQVDAAQNALRQAQSAATAARAAASGGPSGDTVSQARRTLDQAQQALLVAQISVNVFDLDQARAMLQAATTAAALVGVDASPDEIKAAQAQLDRSFAQAEIARGKLRDATVTAPIDGIVTELLSPIGSTVGPFGPVVALIPPQLVATLQADEGQVAQLQKGQKAAVSVDAYPLDSFSGEIKGIAPVLDARTRTVAVKLEVTDPQGKLRPGVFAQISVATGQDSNVVTVPKEAILRLPDTSQRIQNVVFLVVDGHLKRQQVTLGPTDGRNVEVVQGLGEGVDILLTPRADLTDGEAISGV